MAGDEMPRTALGEFEHQILLVSLRLGGGTFSAAVVMELEERTGRSTSPAAVYIAMRRLEKRGLLTSQIIEAEEETGGRTRRYFELSEAGLARLREAH